MALAGADFTAALKTFYLDGLNDNVTRARVLLDRLKKNSEDVSGQYAYVALVSARNPAVGPRADTDAAGPTLPPAGKQTYAAATFQMVYHYGRGSVSGPTMRKSKDNRGAFVKALDAEIKGLQESLPDDLNRQLWAMGNGRAATLSTSITTTALTAVCSAKSICNIRVGDRVHLATIASPGTISAGLPNGTTVTNIVYNTGTALTATLTLTLAAQSTQADATGTYTFYLGAKTSMAAVDSSRKQSMFGIPAVVDDGAIGADEAAATVADEILGGSLNYGGIARTSGSYWASQVFACPSSGTLTVSAVKQGMLRVTALGGANPQDIEIYTNPSIWAHTGSLLTNLRQYNDYKKTMEGGWLAIEIDGRPMFFDRDCPRYQMWFLDMSKLMLLSSSGYEFMDDDGSILSREADKDSYEFTLYKDIQLGASNIRSSGKMYDIKHVAEFDSLDTIVV